jgi:hypothetical protein
MRESAEPRRNHPVCWQFDTAFAMVEPFLEAEKGWAGPSRGPLAFGVGRENFSELNSADVRAGSAHRVCIARHRPAGDHLPRLAELRQSNVIFCWPSEESA